MSARILPSRCCRCGMPAETTNPPSTCFTVALKIVSRDVLHKAEAGGVRLALRSEQEVRDAWHRTHADVATYAPGAKIDGALLSEMVPIAAELLVGFYRDETFGPALV